tara:strand:- start:12598 stop:12942 length:345 start_codon:yes stop_codon:yes gene_type:complete
MRLWAIVRAKTATGAKVSAERDEGLESQVVISVTPAQSETTISRYFLVTAECWAADKVAAFALAGDVAFALESALRDGKPVIRTETPSGPNEERDEAGTYFSSVTVSVVAHRLL